MTVSEDALLIELRGEQLLAIVARPGGPGTARDCGVLVVVGGPQYRVGSHRQFLLLSRRLASEGYPVCRFDYRGMGDASGAARDFSDVSDDIGAALDAFFDASPGLRRVVLWGLCDAASAALLYVQARDDARIVGLALLNPWVRTDVGLAQTQIKHYYGQRLLDRSFWIKLFSGRMQVAKALRDFVATAITARRQPSVAADAARSFQQRMAQGWQRFAGPLLLILSGNDLVAREFTERVMRDADWSGALDSPRVTRVDVSEADHTFSTAMQRARVESETLKWLATL